MQSQPHDHNASITVITQAAVALLERPSWPRAHEGLGRNEYAAVIAEAATSGATLAARRVHHALCRRRGARHGVIVIGGRGLERHRLVADMRVLQLLVIVVLTLGVVEAAGGGWPRVPGFAHAGRRRTTPSAVDAGDFVDGRTMAAAGRGVGERPTPTRGRTATAARGNGMTACGPPRAPRRAAIAITRYAMDTRLTNTAPGYHSQVHLVTHATPSTWRPA